MIEMGFPAVEVFTNEKVEVFINEKTVRHIFPMLRDAARNASCHRTR